jgi:hypothetical protein
MSELEKLDVFRRKRINALIEKSKELSNKRTKLMIEMGKIAKQENLLYRQIEQFWSEVRRSNE